MELQLCLSLPTPITTSCSTTAPITTRGGNDELLFSLMKLNYTTTAAISCTTSAASSTSSSSSPSLSDNLISNMKRKRQRDLDDDAFEVDSHAQSRTLPLLNWNKQPDDDDDDHHRHMTNCSAFSISARDGGGGRDMVGWPPIKSYRRNELAGHDHHRRAIAACRNYLPQQPVENGDDARESSNVIINPSSYVKVQIQGVLITRKIDLSLQRSYQALISTLLTLFGREQESAERYDLAYQDDEGDWLLAAAGDDDDDDVVPWSEFVRSVHRLKLLRRAAN